MPDKVIGIINYFGPNGEIADTQAFTDAEKYLSAIEKAFDHYGINGWKYATQTNDLDVNYARSGFFQERFVHTSKE